MGFSFLGSTSKCATAGSVNGLTTDAIDTSTAKLLIIVINQYMVANPFSANVFELTDSKGNPWTRLTSQHDSGSESECAIFYCLNPSSVGSGHTATFANTSSYASVFFAAWSAGAAVVFDRQNGASSAAATSVQTGVVTPSVDNALIIAFVGVANVRIDVPAVGSGFSLIENRHDTDYGYCGGLAYKTQTIAAPVNPAFTLGSSNRAAAVIASFKESGGVDTTAPTIISAEVKNSAKNEIEITLSESLDEASVSGNSAFGVSGGKTVTGVAVLGNKITLTLNSSYAFGDTITASYTQPSSSKIRDLASTPNNLATVSSFSVTNNIADPSALDMTPIVINKISGTYGDGNTVRFKGLNVVGKAVWDLIAGAGTFSNYDYAASEVDFTQSGSTVPRIRCSTSPFKNIQVGDIVTGYTMQPNGILKATNATNSGSFESAGRGNNNADYIQKRGMDTEVPVTFYDGANTAITTNADDSTKSAKFYVYDVSVPNLAIQYRNGTGYPLQDNDSYIDGGTTFASKSGPTKAIANPVANRALNSIIERFEFGNKPWFTSGTPAVLGISGYKEKIKILDGSDEAGEWVEVLPNDAGWSGGATGTISGSLAYNPTAIAEGTLLNYRRTTSSMTLTKAGTPNQWVYIELYFAHYAQIKATDIFQNGSLLAKVRFGYNTKRVKFLCGWIQRNSSGNLILDFVKNVIGSDDAIFNYARFRPETPDYSAITHEVFDEGDSLVEPYQPDISGDGDNYKGLSRLLAEYFGGNLMNHRLFEIYNVSNKINFINLHNAGETIGDISATKTDQITSRYNSSLTQILLMMAGANNYASSGSAIYGLMNTLLNYIQTACALLKIFPIGVTPRWEDTSHNLEAYNALLRAETTRQGFVDTTIDYDWELNQSTEYRDSPYFLHYAQSGQNRVFNKVKAKIAPLLPAISSDTIAPTPILSAAPTSQTVINMVYGATDGGGGSVAGWDLEWSLTGSNLQEASGTSGWTNLLNNVLTASPYPFGSLSAGTQRFFRFRARDNALTPNVSAWIGANATTWNAAPVITNSGSIADIAASVSTDITIASSGGNGTRIISVKPSTTLPTGITLAGGVITINRAALGSYSFQLRVTDSNGQYSEKSFSGAIVSTPPEVTNPIIRNPANLPYGRTGYAYTYQFIKTGGSGSGTWSALSGNLPGGALSSGGLLTIPSVGGVDYVFTLKFLDTNGSFVSKDFTIPVSVFAAITFVHKRPLEIEPILTISYFENLDESEDVIEDKPLKRVFNMNSLYIGETNRVTLWNFLFENRLRQTFLWVNPDRNEVLAVKMIKLGPERQMFTYGEFEFVLKEV